MPVERTLSIVKPDAVARNIIGEIYSRFFAESGQQRSWYRDESRIPQTWVVGDVEHCVAELQSFIKDHGITDLVTWAVPPGMRPAQMDSSLERFAREVAPRLKAAPPV